MGAILAKRTGVATVFHPGACWAGGQALRAIGSVKPCSTGISLFTKFLLVPQNPLSTPIFTR